MAIKAADMLIARRADTRARADFATWKMLAKLNGASALPAEAQNFLVDYKQMVGKMTDADASEATIQIMYRTYYAEMGGTRACKRAGSRYRHRYRLPPAAGQAEARHLRPGVHAATAGGADLRLPCRGICRHTLLLAIACQYCFIPERF
jgi:hypothetical protein